MRKLTALVTLLAALGVTPAAPAHDLPRTYVVDHIESDWIYQGRDGVVRWYVVNAEIARDLQTGVVVAAKARGGVGRCTADGMSCGLSPVRALEVSRYEADALAQSLTLHVRWGARTARLHFTGGNVGGSPAMEQLDPCNGEATLVHSVTRALSGKGVVFGRRVFTSDDMDRESEELERVVEVC